MSKVDKFLKSYQNAKLSAGDKVTLYKTVYKVIAADDKLVLLKDPKGHPCAYPTSKVREMLLNKSMQKAVVTNQNTNVLHGSDQGTSARTKGSAGLAKPAGKMHAGKVRVDKVDKHGHAYHYWVDAVHGTKHDNHDSTPHKAQIDQASMKFHSEMNSIINKHAHPEDVPKLKKMLDSVIEHKSQYNHLKEAHTQLAKEQGGFHSSTLNHLASKQDNADRALNKLAESLKQSKSRRLK